MTLKIMSSAQPKFERTALKTHCLKSLTWWEALFKKTRHALISKGLYKVRTMKEELH